MAAEVDASILASICALVKQDRDLSLERRTGDFVYASVVTPEPGRRYRLVTNASSARNQARYLGSDEVRFAPIEGARLKAAVLAGLP